MSARASPQPEIAASRPPAHAAGPGARSGQAAVYAAYLATGIMAVLLGPLSYLWLGKCQGGEFDKLALLARLLPVYAQVLDRLAALGVEWVQVDEPILGLDLPPAWQADRKSTRLNSSHIQKSRMPSSA